MSDTLITCRNCEAEMPASAPQCDACGMPARKEPPASVEAPRGEGRTLLEKYRLIRRLGKGGMASVYLGHDDLSGQEVAIKILPRSLAEDPEMARRFVAEARALARLDHPSIVPLITFDIEDGDRFLVMKYVDGESVDERLRKSGPLDFDTIRTVLRAVLDALGHAHEHGIIHRDIKPANVLLAKDGRVFLVDFGIAKRDVESKLTQTGILVGTPLYMSPELITGLPIDGRSDLYSTGLLLYEMLTGKNPYADHPPYALLKAHIEEPVPDPVAVRGEEIPEDLLATLHALLQKNPDQRAANAQEALRVLDGEIEAPPLPFASVEGRPPDAASSSSSEGAPEAFTERLVRTPVTSESPPTEALIRAAKPRGPLIALAGLAGIAVVAVAAIILAGADRDQTTEPAPPQPPRESAPTPPPPDPHEALLKSARRHLEEGRAEAARALLEAILVDAPDHAEAKLLLARAHLQADADDEARAALAEVPPPEQLAPKLADERARVAALLEERMAERHKPEKKRKRRARRPRIPQRLDSDVLEAVAAKHRGRAKRCTEELHARDPSASGTVTLSLRIVPTGRVATVSFVSQTVGGRDLALCLANLARTWRFPRFRDETPIDYEHTFVVRPKG